MDQSQAPMTPPPAQPQWSPPPQQPTGWGGPGYGGPPVRPTGVTLAAIYLIVMGLLVTLFLGGCSLLGAAVIGTAESAAQTGTFFGAGATVFAIVWIVVGILQIAAGAGSMSGAGWARWVGIIMSVVAVILFGLVALAFFGTRDGGSFGIFVAVFAVLYALCAWALISAGSYFAYRRR